MNCPYCQNEMEKGYLQSRDGLGWNSKKVLLAALSGTLAEWPLGKSAEAYRCRMCRKIVIDFDGEKEE